MKTTKPRYSWAAWSLIWCLQIVGGQLSAAWAQRRADEPVANPQFQQQVQQQSSSGGPISGAAGPSSAEPQPSPMEPGASANPDSAASPGGGVSSVQIGPVSGRAASAPEAPINPLETRIVVRVKNAPLATFLDTISAQAKVNFIITEGLEDKRVTAFLQNVTVREALQILLEIKGLTYQRIGKSNTYVVSPRSKEVPNRITRIYTLSYIPLVPISQNPPDLTLKPAEQTGLGGSNPMDSSQQGALNSPPQMGGDNNPNNKENPVAILNVIRSVLTKQFGSIAVDARTNSIIVTDIPEVFPQVEQILAELDKKAPQVIIEAQIVEIDSDRAQQLGLEWGGPNGELATFRGPARDTTFPLNLPVHMSHFHFFDPVSGGITTSISSGLGSQSAGATTGGTTGGLGTTSTTGSSTPNSLSFQSGVLDLTQLKVVLRALVTRSEARFLGKPKILTLNNKAAVIQISQLQAVAANTTVTGGNSGVSQTSSTVQRYPTGLTLKVVPQVNREGYITLLVEPTYTDVTQSPVTTQGGGLIFDPVSRAASTLVRVKNGQTLVLGGLLKSQETKQVRKVPFFGYIPLIGWLFTSTSSRRANTDLVIFLTPSIVTD